MSTILVVDDDPHYLACIVETLQRRGHTVTGVASALEAVTLLRTAEFDIVVTDVIMPEMDGIEFLREVIAHDPAIDVVVMSGCAPDFQAPVKRLMFAMGARAFLEKPFDPNQLIETLGRPDETQN